MSILNINLAEPVSEPLNLKKNPPTWKLCLATATHNFKWVKITHICLIWKQTFALFDVVHICLAKFNDKWIVVLVRYE